MSVVTTSASELKAKNEALKATLATLKQESAPPAPVASEAQKKADQKLKIIAIEKKCFEETQKIERLETEAKHIAEQLKSSRSRLKEFEKEVDVIRNSNAAVWETVGRQTITYLDPFHTGLSKRTPTGASTPAFRPLHTHPPRVSAEPTPRARSPFPASSLSRLQSCSSAHALLCPPTTQAATSRHRALREPRIRGQRLRVSRRTPCHGCGKPRM